ncbi:HEAT repeat-containing protein 6 isoform X3 [Zootermopsis nevadensis]|uniref:HEAT repeat-containing protein 6 isoform X3 n=1 Tax=Zootermopsis nevadensis TaxID=136037 RepID=UPI000B8E943D|nr:HEAT repeat-containing protein 6 isoform X3 [Zootermopsis nevadensis]
MAAVFNALNEDCKAKFQHLACSLTSFVHGSGEGDRQKLNSIFDELNALDFRSPLVGNSDKAVHIVNQCSSVVPPNDTFLVAKACQLISNLIMRQDVKVEGRPLSAAVRWCVQCLKCCGDAAILDILLALETLLRGNGSSIHEQMHELVGENGALTFLLDDGRGPDRKGDRLILVSSWEVHLMTIKCFESLVFLPDTKGPPAGGLQLPYLEVLTVSLRGLQSILQQSAHLVKQLLGEALGVIRTYMLYGIHGYADLRPQQVFPANLSLCDMRQSGRGGKSSRARKRNLQHQKKSDSATRKNVEAGFGQDLTYTVGDSVAAESSLGTSLYPCLLKTSDSDFSDAEGGQAVKTRVTQGRVRKAALSLLACITKVCEQKVLFGYWSSLLPDGKDMLHAPTLCACLLKDPSSSNRTLVLQILIAMLMRSRLYLSQAEESSKNFTSFTAFSVTVGNIVWELHQSLCMALAMENSILVIIQLLKCLAALIQNTPYHRLKTGLITQLVENVRPYLRHKDSGIKVASLTVLGAVVAVDPVTPEIMDILCEGSVIDCRQKACDTAYRASDVQRDLSQDRNHEDSTAVPLQCDNTHISWLLEVCLKNLQQPSLSEGIRTMRVDDDVGLLPCSAPVRIESQQVLTILARKHFIPVVNRHLGQLMQLLGWTLTDANVNVCLHSGRVIEALGISMWQCLREQDGSTAGLLDRNLQFWQTVLSGPLISLVQNVEEASLRAVGCDCLAAIGAEVFEQLPRNKQILIVTLLFGCSHDEDIGVRSSAVRALATCVLFPALRADIHFIIDAAECAIRTVHDESLLVRTKASWCLGNLSEALVLSSMADDTEDIPKELFLKLMETSIKAAHDNDKVRSCAVRAVGNFVRLVTEDLMNKSDFRECNDKAIAVLVHNSTKGNNMKVRWNACYAIGNMMRNSALYSVNSVWQNTVFSALTKLVQDARNFKVRISAATALAVPSNRQQYGSCYISTWTALLNGLDNSQNMEDFSEYQHRDSLLNQICLTLSHLASVATRRDLAPLQDLLTFHLDTLQQHLLRFHERVVPEKAAALAAASNHATSLLHLSDLTPNENSAAALLTSMFLQDPDLPLHQN